MGDTEAPSLVDIARTAEELGAASAFPTQTGHGETVPEAGPHADGPPSATGSATEPVPESVPGEKRGANAGQ